MRLLGLLLVLCLLPGAFAASDLIKNGVIQVNATGMDVLGYFQTSGVTRIDASGVGTFASGTTVNSQTICLADGTNCPASSADSGWLNSTTQVWLVNNATNVSAGWTNSQPTLFVDTADRRVGIGTTTPTRPLVVKQVSSNAPVLAIQDDDTTDSFDFTYRFSGGPNLDINWSAGSARVFSLLTLNGDTGALGLNDSSPDYRLELVKSAGSGYFGVTSSSDGDIFEIDSNGNVGIGTNNPNSTLHIEAAGAYPELIIKSDTNPYLGQVTIDANRSAAGSDLGRYRAKWNGTTVASIDMQTGADTTNKDDGRIQFRTASGGTLTARMIINEDGNVGIGNTTPPYKLTIDNYDVSGGYTILLNTNTSVATSNLAGISVNPTISGVSSSYTNTGVIAISTTDTGGNASAQYAGGFYSHISSYGPNGAGNSYGVVGSSRLLNNGTVGTSYGGYFNADNQNGTITNQYGIYARAYTQSSGAVTTNAHGVRVQVFENGGSIGTGYAFRASCSGADTCYGLHIADLGGTTNYGIYQAGTDDLNYFGSNINMASGTEVFFADNGQIRSLDNYHRLIFNRSSNIMELQEYGDIILSSGSVSGTRTSVLTATSGQAVTIGTGTPGNASGTGDLYVTSDIEYDANLYGPGADLAELIHASESVGAGDVVEADPDADETVRLSTGAYSTRAIGVISTDPSIILSKEKGDAALAISGRVPVKATDENGPIARGDLLTTSSTPGRAMRCADAYDCRGAIIGKALGTLTDGEGTIPMIVMLG